MPADHLKIVPQSSPVFAEGFLAARVVLAARREEALASAAEGISGATTLRLDVTSARAVPPRQRYSAGGHIGQ